jgi:hypothetical protein
MALLYPRGMKCRGYSFPMIGKTGLKISNHWKNGTRNHP